MDMAESQYESIKIRLKYLMSAIFLYPAAFRSVP